MQILQMSTNGVMMMPDACPASLDKTTANKDRSRTTMLMLAVKGDSCSNKEYYWYAKISFFHPFPLH